MGNNQGILNSVWSLTLALDGDDWSKVFLTLHDENFHLVLLFHSSFGDHVYLRERELIISCLAKNINWNQHTRELISTQNP